MDLLTPSSTNLYAPPYTPCTRSSNLHFQEQKGIKWKNPVLLRWSVFLSSPLPTAASQAGVEQDVGCRGLDGGGVDLRHLVVVELVPALLEAVLTVGSVMAAVQPSIVVLVADETSQWR